MGGLTSTKRKRSTRNDLSDDNNVADQEDVARAYQTLPVADLPPDFDGVPLDGAQYLAIVRQESSTVPVVSYAVNPYAKPDVSEQITSSGSSWNKDEDVSAMMPSMEWRKRFLTRFSNMRNSLANRSGVTHSDSEKNVTIPRGRNAKIWYKYIHGRDIIEEIEYDEEQDDNTATDSKIDEMDKDSKEPSEAMLHCFSSTQIITLLSLIPYWLTQPHMQPKDSERSAIDPFHSRWIFSLLAHLDEHLTGDDISVLRTLARACLACIVKSRVEKKVQGKELEEVEVHLQDEMGAWMVICLIVGIWGQHDIWDDGHRDLLLYAS